MINLLMWREFVLQTCFTEPCKLLVITSFTNELKILLFGQTKISPIIAEFHKYYSISRDDILNLSIEQVFLYVMII